MYSVNYVMDNAFKYRKTFQNNTIVIINCKCEMFSFFEEFVFAVGNKAIII